MRLIQYIQATIRLVFRSPGLVSSPVQLVPIERMTSRGLGQLRALFGVEGAIFKGEEANDLVE